MMEQIEARYFRSQIGKGVRQVFGAQREIAESEIYPRTHSLITGLPLNRSGTLLAALTAPSFEVRDSGGGLEATSDVPWYIRMLDMKNKGNYGIYNRQIWGILYGETIRNIKYEYRDWIREHYPELLGSISGG